jgi:VWFA-related protein
LKFSRTCLFAALVGAAGAVGQPPGIGRGQSVFVVAIRVAGDTRVLRTCPMGNVRPASPPAYPGPELAPAGAAGYPGGVPDPAVRADVERILRAQKRLSVVSSFEQADLVLVVQAAFAPVFTASIPGQQQAQNSRPWPPPLPTPWPDESRVTAGPPDLSPAPARGQPGVYINAGQPDIPPNTLLELLAFVVPGPAYRQAPADIGALVGARLWEGWEMGVNARGVTLDNLVRSIAGSRDRIYWPNVPNASFNGNQAVCLAPVPPRAAPIPAGAGDAPIAATADRPARAGDGAAPAPSGGAVVTFRTAVDAVAVPVTVEDEKGRPVPGLAATDFRVFEDDAEQRIEAVLTEGEPLDVALVLDTSASMRARIEETRSAGAAFVEALGPDDRVMVVSFNSRAYLGCELTSDRGDIRRAILLARTGGSLTRLYDTLDAVVTERLERIPRRKAVVLLTDGVDVGSGFATAQAAIERFQSSNVPVFALRYDTRGDLRPGAPSVMPRSAVPLAVPSGLFYQEPFYETARRFLWDLGQASGGRVDVAAAPEEIAKGFGRIAAELRRQYVLYYYSPHARGEGMHRIRVEVGRPGLVVRSRTMFRAAR